MSGTGPEPSRRFSTGTESLDRLLDGGLPVGDLLALVAPPTSGSELLLRQLAGTRAALYVDTSGAPETEVARRFPDDGSTTVVAADPETLVADSDAVADRIPPEAFVVVDAVDHIEAVADRDAYCRLLNAFAARLREVDSVGVLHCFDTDETPARRPTTLHRADDIWQLRVQYGNREIRYQLLVTKARYNRALTEPVPIRLTDRVRIDTSWNI